jgi:hypothetical protein
MDLFLALTISGIDEPKKLASVLFSHCVSGTRILTSSEKETICGHVFQGYGCHISDYPVSYLNSSITLGITQKMIDDYLVKLELIFKDLKKHQPPKSPKLVIPHSPKPHHSTLQNTPSDPLFNSPSSGPTFLTIPDPTSPVSNDKMDGKTELK